MFDHTIPVEAEDLLDIYESTDDENVREQIIDLLVATPTAPLEQLYPKVELEGEGLDANELTREIVGVEEPTEAVAWIRNETEGDAHVSTKRGHGNQPYVVDTDETPPGWETAHQDGENARYLRKQ